MPNSNLLTSSENLRNSLYTRNLYTPYVQYPLPMNNVEKVITVIDTIVGGIAPFKSIDLPDSILGRVANIGAETPLSKIGLVMLAKQMTLNEMSHVAQQTFPVMNVSNLFDGNPTTNLFTPNVDYHITVDNNQSEFGRFVDKIFFSQQSDANPFPKTGATNNEFIENTGRGQLINMYRLLGLNQYRPTEDNNENSAFYKFADDLGTKKISSNELNNIKYIDLINNKFNPYNRNSYNEMLINIANNWMNYGVYARGVTEYGADVNFIDMLGDSRYDINKLNAWNSSDDNSWVETGFESEGSGYKNIVWGRDGVNDAYVGFSGINNKQGTFNKPNIGGDDNNQFADSFNIHYGGLLEYTRNLVTATSGRVGDLTRKAFTKGDGSLDGFNGSGLWKSNGSKYAEASGFNEHTGVRQHTTLDQYDRFTKAIRFNGNSVYNGNPDSVIYDKVTPRIAPIKNKDGSVDAKNLMFSIENLAVHVIKPAKFEGKNAVGIMDDENGSMIPICEVGPFNGRIMWFPPYALDIQETSTAKFESTVMIGRNEPMYNYVHSERSATLNFKLLIDYPPQVEGKDYKGAAEFFAFGGDVIPDETGDISKIELQIKIKENERENLYVDEEPPELKRPEEFYIYYPNDYPKPSDTNSTTIFDDMYKKRYEIRDNVDASEYNNSVGGINNGLYYISGLTAYDSNGVTKYRFDTEPAFSQYTATGLTNEDGTVSQLNKILYDAFVDPAFVEYYDINIVGGASQLHTTGYNKLLGTRRANAAQNLIESRLKTMFPNITPNFTNYDLHSVGEEGALDIGADKSNVNNSGVKMDRFAHISFIPKVNPPTPKKVILDQKLYDDITKEIESLENLKNLIPAAANTSKDCGFNEQESDKMLGQFESFGSGHKYYQPIFHSQTPEDFHKRLTFLQQCTRQGSSKSYYYSKLPNGDQNRVRNSVFGRQPICILRIGDFFYTKVIIESVNVDYNNTTWDMNPEGFGLQPMIASVTLNMKVLGGQSLKGPIDALQNAVSYNYYANSSYTNKGRYALPYGEADKQWNYKSGVMSDDVKKYSSAYDDTLKGLQNIKEEKK